VAVPPQNASESKFGWNKTGQALHRIRIAKSKNRELLEEIAIRCCLIPSKRVNNAEKMEIQKL
jgi:hypothetical protein